jgi:hypothetical protein
MIEQVSHGRQRGGPVVEIDGLGGGLDPAYRHSFLGGPLVGVHVLYTWGVACVYAEAPNEH